MMSHSVSSLLAGIALSTLVAACAGPSAQSGSASTGSPSAGLSGTWSGFFVHPGADYTSPSSADLSLQVREDSTYTFKWGTRPERTGTLAVEGNRVVLDDSTGSRVTLMHSGDALYGVMKDTATGRAAMMSLEKQGPPSGRVAATSARLCTAAGGVFARNTCQPAADPIVGAQQCEARGGVYFAGGDYCEVPATGLRPR